MTTAPAPASAEDVLAALQLVARFEQAADRRDVAGFAEFFTGTGEVTGLMSAGRGNFAAVLDHDRDGPPLVHLTANHQVEPDGDDRLLLSYVLLVLAATDDGPTLLRISRITDHLQRTSQGWRIQRHHVAAAHTG